MHNVSWDVVTLPKHLGGLGIKKGLACNKALFAKRVWALCTNSCNAWAETLRKSHSPIRKFLQDPLHANDTTLKVKDTWDKNGNWDLNGLSFVLPRQVCNIIRVTPKPFQSSLNDLPTWNSTSNGQFSTHLAYFLATNLPTETNSQNWKWVWKTHTIPRGMTFLWLACHNCLPTKHHLALKHILNDESCPLYHSNPENHHSYP
ncbi:hypothetical protein CMV_021496 [Castanea mollissima]|uniref:Reverse transcriptase zinc-binding domain-containing protein n=1 Tax=Castanea mollissima TaxID=60419 RepID=A0A8J4QL71_9ROSI|nr:hypothetical protein CMV_021496 [Castanea mollissima]